MNKSLVNAAKKYKKFKISATPNNCIEKVNQK